MTGGAISNTGKDRTPRFAGVLGPGLASWIAARWDIPPRGRIGAPAQVFEKKRGGPWSRAGRHASISLERTLQTLHAHFTVNLHLRLARMVRERTIAATASRGVPAAREHAGSLPFPTRGAWWNRLATVRSEFRRLAGSVVGIAGRSPAMFHHRRERVTSPGDPRLILTREIVLPRRTAPAGDARKEPADASRAAHWFTRVFSYRSFAGATSLVATGISIGQRDRQEWVRVLQHRLANHALRRADVTRWLQLSPSLASRAADKGPGESAASVRAATPLTLQAAAHRTLDRAEAAPARWSGAAPAVTLAYAKPEPNHFGSITQTLSQIQQTLNAANAAQPRETAPPSVDINHLTRQVYNQLERELRIEKERRGL